MVTLTSPMLRVLAVVALIAAAPAAQGVPRLDSYNGVAVRILQSNSAGDIHHIIDPTINRVVGIIRGCPHAHNLTVHPDGLYYYCANEQDKTVDVFDVIRSVAVHHPVHGPAKAGHYVLDREPTCVSRCAA